MNIIVSNSNREIDGFQSVLAQDLPDVTNAELYFIEPTFLSFKNATDNDLGQIFNIAEEIASKPEAKTLVFSIWYSRENVARFKGFLIDFNNRVMELGFQQMNQYHIPWESYGATLVGSSLFLVFSKSRFMLVPNKDPAFPADLYPELLSHAPKTGYKTNLRVSGAGASFGFLQSNRAYLPHIELWPAGILDVELREGVTSVTGRVPEATMADIWGLEVGDKHTSYVGMTPKAIIKLVDQIQYF